MRASIFFSHSISLFRTPAPTLTLRGNVREQGSSGKLKGLKRKSLPPPPKKKSRVVQYCLPVLSCYSLPTFPLGPSTLARPERVMRTAQKGYESLQTSAAVLLLSFPRLLRGCGTRSSRPILIVSDSLPDLTLAATSRHLLLSCRPLLFLSFLIQFCRIYLYFTLSGHVHAPPTCQLDCPSYRRRRPCDFPFLSLFLFSPLSLPRQTSHLIFEAIPYCATCVFPLFSSWAASSPFNIIAQDFLLIAMKRASAKGLTLDSRTAEADAFEDLPEHPSSADIQAASVNVSLADLEDRVADVRDSWETDSLFEDAFEELSKDGVETWDCKCAVLLNCVSHIRPRPASRVSITITTPLFLSFVVNRLPKFFVPSAGALCRLVSSSCFRRA